MRSPVWVKRAIAGGTNSAASCEIGRSAWPVAPSATAAGAWVWTTLSTSARAAIASVCSGNSASRRPSPSTTWPSRPTSMTCSGPTSSKP